MKLENLSYDEWKFHIFTPKEDMVHYVPYVEANKTATFVLANKEKDIYAKDIFITKHLADGLYRALAEEKIKADETHKFVAKYITHEILHRCISEVDGWVSGSAYDRLVGGYSNGRDSCGGGFRGLDEVLP